MEVIEQGGGSLPDARIRPRPDADPAVEELTGGEVTPVEAERTTGSSKPAQTVINPAGAVNNGQRCVFVASADDADRVWSTLTEEPRYASAYDETADETLLLNSTKEVRVGGEKVYRRGSRISRWFRDETTGERVLRDDNGTEHARFDSPEDVFTDAEAYVATGRDGERDPDLRPVRAPAIPEWEFDGEPPTEDTIEEHCTLLVADGGDLGVCDPDGDPQPLDSLAGDRTEPVVDAADLDVPDRAVTLLGLLQEADADVFTTGDAATIADEHGGEELDASRRTISNWISKLEEEGAL